MFSMPIREGTPQPMSTKAPKGSRWVTTAGMIMPGRSPASMASRAARWARRRESRGRRAPSASSSPSTVKQTGLPTRERMAISRVVPSAMPRAASSRGITPVKGPTDTSRLWPSSHSWATPSRTVFSSMARRSVPAEAQAASFSGVCSRRPSGG